MPVDCDRPTKPVLVHLDPDDWAEFKAIAGSRQASRRLRQLIRSELRMARAIARVDKR